MSSPWLELGRSKEKLPFQPQAGAKALSQLRGCSCGGQAGPGCPGGCWGVSAHTYGFQIPGDKKEALRAEMGDVQ